MAAPYLPASDAAFDAWLTNFSTLLTAAPATYGLVAGDAVIVAAQQTAYNAAYIAATTPATRTSVTVAAKDAARASAEAVVRPYAVSISLNAGVLDGDKTAIGVTVPKLVPTPIPAPTATPLVSLVSAVPTVATLKVVNAATPTSKAKPFGAIGVQMFAAIGTVPATDPAQLSWFSQPTKIPTAMTFDVADAGKICTVAARYITRGGNGGEAKVGPWSALVSFVIL